MITYLGVSFLDVCRTDLTYSLQSNNEGVIGKESNRGVDIEATMAHIHEFVNNIKPKYRQRQTLRDYIVIFEQFCNKRKI